MQLKKQKTYQVGDVVAYRKSHWTELSTIQQKRKNLYFFTPEETQINGVTAGELLGKLIPTHKGLNKTTPQKPKGT